MSSKKHVLKTYTQIGEKQEIKNRIIVLTLMEKSQSDYINIRIKC
jgi:hypothetical protein